MVILGVLSASCAARASQRDKTDLAREVDKLFSDWNTSGSPGGAIVLVDRGKVILERCYGLASIEHRIPIRPTTRFELASVSKHFTAFAVLMLERAGKLSLGDKIQDYLSELPDYGASITVADLLYQTSGLSDWPTVRQYAGKGTYGGFGIKDLLSLTSRQRKLEFEPGTKWSYSNTNYALLAEIVSRVTGKPFGEWMQENVFAPLKMQGTSVPVNGRTVIPNRASSYQPLPTGEFARSLVEGFEIPGPAHVFTTLEDMAKWIGNFHTGKVGGPDIMERMQRRPTLRSGEVSVYGAGLGVGEYRGVRTATHAGQTGGFKSELIYCPELGVGVLVVGNAQSLRTTDIACRTLDLYLGAKLRPVPGTAAPAVARREEAPSFTLNSAEYRRFVGGYRLDADSSVLVAVAREGDWLVGGMVGEGMDLFRPIATSEFENRGKNCRLAFSEADTGAGTPRRVRITLRGNEMWATYVPPPPDSHWIDECAGLYYSDELEVAYTIVREAEGLTVHIPDSGRRLLEAVDVNTLFGGLGIVNLLRDESGRVVAFDLGEPEDLGERTIRFVKRVECR
jgi:CubicO group peptidase (beta-lactamase class C family)